MQRLPKFVKYQNAHLISSFTIFLQIDDLALTTPDSIFEMVEAVKIKNLVLITALACFGGMAGGAESIELSVDSERKILKTSEEECVLQFEVTGKKSPTEKRKVPLNLAVVLDRSGSMSGAKIEKARQAAALALGLIGPDDTFALVVYDNEVQTIIPAGKVKDAQELEKQIQAIQPGGSTALHAGVKEGGEQLTQVPQIKKLIC